RDLVQAFVLVVLVTVLDGDAADLGLAVRHGAGDIDDQRALLVAAGEAFIVAEGGDHDTAAAGTPADAAAGERNIGELDVGDAAIRHGKGRETAAREAAAAGLDANAEGGFGGSRFGQGQALDGFFLALAQDHHIDSFLRLDVLDHVGEVGGLVGHGLAG